jgi:type IV pilus assembly protein PilE
MKQKGVTFVELLVVMVIVAILAIVALPSYRTFVIRSQRGEAKEALLRLASNQERYYLQNQSYSADLGVLGFSSGETETGLYALEVVAADRQGFTATASPASGSAMQSDADCQLFGINAALERTASPDPRGNCW